MIKGIPYVDIAFFYMKANILCRWSNILHIFNRNKGLCRSFKACDTGPAPPSLPPSLPPCQCLPACLPAYLPTCLPASLPASLPACLPLCLSTIQLTPSNILRTPSNILCTQSNILYTPPPNILHTPPRKGISTPQCTTPGGKGSADQVSIASQVRFTQNI